MAAAAGFLLLYAGAAFAQDVNPVPSLELCPDGTPRIVWKYPPEAGIPSNAVAMRCGNGETCYVVPESACLQVVEQSTRQHAREQPRVIDAPEDPASHLLPVSVPRQPATPSPVRPIPVSGVPAPAPATPEQECDAGDGWDFETLAQPFPTFASLDGWEGSRNSGSPFADIRNADLDLKAAPVYGNAAPIDRIRPPGWSPSMTQSIGGDYWMYSQSVNHHGDFWISSRYRRYSWGQHPGAEWNSRARGTLTSPPCVLRARYLTFRLSGARSPAQRIEVLVEGAAARDYFGIRFPGGLGDPALAGSTGHATQLVSHPPDQAAFPPEAGTWMTVRSVTSEDHSESEWMQVYVFDLEPFMHRRVRIRIVDDARNECATFNGRTCVAQHASHVNADEFRFGDAPPSGVRWLNFNERRCGGVPGTGAGCSPVGHVPSEPPLWGVTDAHAHPMANLAFGGHVVWGDVADKLEDIYDCSRALNEIPGPGGRKAIPEPAVSSACFIAGDVVLIATAAALTGCTALTVVPFVGVGAAVLCKTAVSVAQAFLLTTPIIRGLTVHGAQRFANGAFQLGGIFSESFLLGLRLAGAVGGDAELMFAAGLLPEIDSWSNAEPTVDWYPRDKKWHSYTGLAKTHNHYQADMIRRAHAGGLRLAVWDVVNSRAFAYVADGNPNAPDWQALKDQSDAAKRIVSGPLASIADIAYSPEDAERIVRSGKVAVILGTEVDELGRMRPEGLPWPRSPRTAGDSMQKQVDDLWDLGIRKVTPVHAVNNPIGGAAIFNKDYVANNHFLNGTPLDGTPSFFDTPAVRFFLDRSVAGIVLKVVLGTFSPLKTIGGDGRTPWNPQGWFELDGSPHVLDTIIDGYDLITYRIGQDDPPLSGNPPHKRLKGDDGRWLPPRDVLNEQILIPKAFNDLSTFIRPTGRCDLHNTVKPTYNRDGFGPVVDAQFEAEDGHRNALGVYQASGGNDGAAFLRAAMKKGMLLDVDHLSQRMRLDVYRITAQFAREAKWAAPGACVDGQPCGDYPVIGVHSTVRELEKEGGDLPHLIDRFGSNDESTRTEKEISYVAERGGTIGVFPRPNFIAPNTTGGQCTKDSDCASWTGGPGACGNGQCSAQVATTLAPRNFEIPAEVQNDCDGSSKTFAVKYLWMLRQMRGHGLTFTSDFNGLNGTQYPRFGVSIPGKAACGQEGRGRSLRDKRPWPFVMAAWQRVEHSGIWYDDYAQRSPSVSPLADQWEDPDQQLPKKRWKTVVARDQLEVREDRAPRYTTYRDGSAIRDRVFYNDFGPNIAERYWYDQDANVPGAQLYPLKRWRNLFDGWDLNLDGFQHIGLLPDLIQDMRNVGVQWEQMGPLFNGAHDFIATWSRSAAIGRAHP